MDRSLSPHECIKKIWYSLFIIRLWRKYIIRTKKLTVKDNFLTSNSYSCLELNAHSIIHIILFLKRTNQPHLFRPILFSSQPCEEFYRQIRSFTTVYSTVANCTTKEVLGRIKKIQLQNDISSSNSEFVFPRSSRSTESSKTSFVLPSETEIIKIVEDSKLQAIDDALKLGLLKVKVDKIPCEFDPYIPKSTVNVRKRLAAMTLSDEGPNEIIDLKDLDLKNFAQKFNGVEINETGPYVEIHGGKNRMVIKKTSLCWLLSKDTVKLSSDRLERVKNSYACHQPKKALKTIRIKLGRKYHQKRLQRAIKY